MIRLAEHKDTRVVVELLQEFLKETAYSQAEQASNDIEHLCKIVWTAQQYGRIWLAERDSKAVGLLIALKEPNMWLPKAKELRELVWYVLPDYRNTTLGGRLFKAYTDYAEKLLNTGEIQGYFTTRMTTTADYDLERRGFKLKEKTYLRD